MIPPATGAATPPDANTAQHDKLRKAAHQLEGVFLAQLFQVMRQSVPTSGSTTAGNGESMYQSMRDDMLASTAAERSMHGLGEALYRQLSRRLPPLQPSEAAPAVPPASHG